MKSYLGYFEIILALTLKKIYNKKIEILNDICKKWREKYEEVK